MTFSIGVDHILVTLQKKYNKNRRRFLSRIRSLEMYSPPSEFKVEKLISDNHRYAVALGVYYIIGCLSFIFAVIFLIQSLETGIYYLINKEAFCSELGNRHQCQTTYQYDLRNVFEFWDSLSENIFPKIYSTKWYNGQDKSLPQERYQDTGWMVNEVDRLIGVPRIRQIRVKPIAESLCHVPEIMTVIAKRCQIPTSWLSDDTEDNKDYGVGWSNTSWFRELFEVSPWKYTKPADNDDTYFIGPSGQEYRDGGYVAFLHRDLLKTKASLSSLFDTNWIDVNTRVIFTDFLMYNANRDVFTQTYIITEVHTIGSVKVEFYIESMVFTTYPLSGMFFCLMVAIYCLQFFWLMNVVGTKKFLSNNWNLLDCLVMLMFLYATIVYFTWLFKVIAKRQILLKQGIDVYFSVDEMSNLSYDNINLVGYIFAFLVFRLLRAIRFNEDVKSYVEDLLQTKIEIFFAFLITAMLLFVQYRFIMFLTVPPTASNLKNVLVFKSRFKKLIRSAYRNSTTGKILSYILNFTSQLGIFTFMLSQYHQLKVAQETKKHNLEQRQKRADILIGKLSQ